MNTGLRKLTISEREILQRLLSIDFPGKEQLLLQADDCDVRTISEYMDNYGSIEFAVRSGPAAPVTQRVPVTGHALDSDGIPIEFLLHVVHGFLRELEVVKADGSPIQRYPRAADVEVFIRGT